MQRPGAVDPEAAVHSDTFFSTHKAWLYLTRVEECDGPLVYYPGSHRLLLSELRGVYRSSVDDRRQARRISAVELRRRAIDPMMVRCAPNTPVVANTFGYHGRCRVMGQRRDRGRVVSS